MKRKILIGLFVMVLMIALASAAYYSAPWSSDANAGNYNLFNVNNITANNFIGNISADVEWTDLKDYPTACPGSGAITTLDDSVTCQDLWVDITGDNVADLTIFDSSDLGSEIHTQANAASDPNGNEADALTGWTMTSGALASASADPYVGTYNIRGDSDNGNNDYMEYSFTVVDGKTYKITFAAKRGVQGITQEVSGWEGFTTSPNFSIPSTSWATYEVILLANDTSAKMKIWAAVSGEMDDKVHIDNVSIRQVIGGDLEVNGNALFNSNLNVTGNIYVQGCITYNMSGTLAVLGDCI